MHLAASTSDYLAGASVLVALIGVIVAVAAAVYAKRSADATDEAVGMARTEHQEFLAELRRHARFVLTLTAQNEGPAGVVTTEGSVMPFRLEVGLSNEGTRAAGQTTVNVLFPSRYRPDATWSGPQGGPLEAMASTMATDEMLHDGVSQVEASYLSKVLPRVGRRDHGVLFGQFGVTVPAPGEPPVLVPIRLYADADELANDDKPMVERVFRVRHSQAPS